MTKKVLVYGLTSNLGGLETFIIDNLRVMDMTGLEIHLLVNEPPIFEEELLEHGFHIHRITRRGEDYFGNIRETSRLFEEEKFDSLWMNVCTLSMIEPMKQAYRAGVRNRIVHVHCPWASGGWKMKTLHSLHRRPIQRYANYFWACSQGAANYSYSADIQASRRYRLIPNAIDLNRFRYREEGRKRIRQQLGLGDSLVLGHVGHLSDVKNQSYLLDIFWSVKRQNPQAQLVLVGDGDRERALRKKAEHLGLTTSVHFIGNQKGVEDYYAAFDILVFPSRYEGRPLAVVEAQACGLPCLLSDQIDEGVVVTDRVRFEDIGESPRRWRDAIFEMVEENRVQPDPALFAAKGLDVRENAKIIRSFLIH